MLIIMLVRIFDGGLIHTKNLTYAHTYIHTHICMYANILSTVYVRMPTVHM